MTFAGSEVFARACSTVGLVTMGFPLTFLIYCIVFTQRQPSKSRARTRRAQVRRVRNDVVSGVHKRLIVPSRAAVRPQTPAPRNYELVTPTPASAPRQPPDDRYSKTALRQFVETAAIPFCAAVVRRSAAGNAPRSKPSTALTLVSRIDLVATR